MSMLGIVVISDCNSVTRMCKSQACVFQRKLGCTTRCSWIFVYWIWIHQIRNEVDHLVT